MLRLGCDDLILWFRYYVKQSPTKKHPHTVRSPRAGVVDYSPWAASRSVQSMS